jgi:hypothetical protein
MYPNILNPSTDYILALQDTNTRGKQDPASESPYWFTQSHCMWILSVIRNSNNYKTSRFGNRICFRLQVRGGKYLLFRPLETANLFHWTFGWDDGDTSVESIRKDWTSDWG